jgi:LL-diaminopimelate aminotransferase
MATTAQPDIKALYSELWKDSEEYIMFRIAKRVADLTDELKAKGRAPLKLSIGAPTIPPPQFLQNILIESLKEPEIHVYSTTRGELFYREAIAQRMKRRFGFEVCPKTEVISLIGSKEGLANMFRGLVTPSTTLQTQDIILTPDPGYASYVDSIRGAGGHSYGFPLTPENDYRPNLEDVRSKLMADGFDPARIKAVIINYPSNPLGVGAPLSYYEHVVAVARKYNWLVISDNAYADLFFPNTDRPHSILEVAGAKEVAIEMHSLSKPYCLTGWRIGYAVGNKDAIDLLATVKSTVDSGLFKGIQRTGAFALNSPECEDFIASVGKVYQESQNVFVAGLKELGWPVEQMHLPNATFYLWMPIPTYYTSCVQFANDILEKSGIVVVPGTGFGKFGEGFVRLSLVLPNAQLLEVIERMKQDGFTYTR